MFNPRPPKFHFVCVYGKNTIIKKIGMPCLMVSIRLNPTSRSRRRWKIILVNSSKSPRKKFFTKQSEDNLVFTLDGEGDGLSSTVSRLNSDDIIVLSRGSKAFSLGYF